MFLRENFGARMFKLSKERLKLGWMLYKESLKLGWML